MNRNRLTYKRATEPWEFEQIHHLNYQTFVEEIPQHSPNSKGWLVDKFHEENTYFICLDGRRVAGMVAARGKRPFSLDAKMENLDDFLPVGESVCEVRLLAVEPEFRHTNVFAGCFSLRPRSVSGRDIHWEWFQVHCVRRVCTPGWVLSRLQSL